MSQWSDEIYGPQYCLQFVRNGLGIATVIREGALISVKAAEYWPFSDLEAAKRFAEGLPDQIEIS